jgi:lipopolysaccharide export system permease protein
MKILHFYIAREFLRWLVMCLVAFVAIVIIVDLTENYGRYRDMEVPVKDLTLFYLYQVPYLIVLVFPVALLIACFFSIGGMARHSEIVAMKTTGLNLLWILSPILYLGLFISLLSVVMGGILVPYTNSMVEEIKKTKIKKHLSVKGETRTNVFLRGGSAEKELIYYIKSFNTTTNEMKGVLIQAYDGENLIERLDAKEGHWKRNRWVFHDGYYRQFDEEGVETDTPFAYMVLPGLNEKPYNFAERQKVPDEMNIFELRDYIVRVSKEGGEVHKEKVDFHFRIAFPFANFLILLFGSPLTSTYRRSGMALGFVISVFVGFIFYAIAHAGQSLGHSGVMSPILSAWLINIIFFLSGTALFVRELRR